MVFSLLAVGSINEALLGNYICTIVELLSKGAKSNNIKLIDRCRSIMLWMSRDRLIVEMIHGVKFQDMLQRSVDELIHSLAECRHAETVNSILSLMIKLLRTNLISNKKFTEAFIPDLIPLLKNSRIADDLLELVTDLLKNSSSLSLMDQVGSEERMKELVNEAVRLINNSGNSTLPDSCKTLGFGLQILQNILLITFLVLFFIHKYF